MASQLRELDDEEVRHLMTRNFGGTWEFKFGRPQLPEHRLAARFETARSGRYLVTGLLLLGDGITADDLRRISVSHLEDFMNEPKIMAKQKRLVHALGQLPPLVREPGEPVSEFLPIVAEHYQIWAQLEKHPAHHMARESGITPATVHSWIRLARQAGLIRETTRDKSERVRSGREEDDA